MRGTAIFARRQLGSVFDTELIVKTNCILYEDAGFPWLDLLWCLWLRGSTGVTLWTLYSTELFLLIHNWLFQHRQGCVLVGIENVNLDVEVYKSILVLRLNFKLDFGLESEYYFTFYTPNVCTCSFTASLAGEDLWRREYMPPEGRRLLAAARVFPYDGGLYHFGVSIW